MRAGLESALRGPGDHLAAANRLCVACVDLLHVDGASISFIYEGAPRGTFGASSEMSRRLDELQFTFGEGPCLEVVAGGQPVLVPDIGDPMEHRWPAFANAALSAGVQAVFALPATVASTHIGVLDLFRNEPGPLSDDDMAGGLAAAELATLPILDLMAAGASSGDVDDLGPDRSKIASLERVEIYQATGMVMEQLGVGPVDALVRLRAHAFASGQTASDVAWAIVERRLVLQADDSWRSPAAPEPSP